MQIFLLYFKMMRGHNNIVYEGCHNFLYKNGFYKNVGNVNKFRKNLKYRKHVHRDDIQDALSPSTVNFVLFPMKQYIRINSDV